MTANEIVRVETLAATLTTVERFDRARAAYIYRIPAGKRLNQILEIVDARYDALVDERIAALEAAGQY